MFFVFWFLIFVFGGFERVLDLDVVFVFLFIVGLRLDGECLRVLRIKEYKMNFSSDNIYKIKNV